MRITLRMIECKVDLLNMIHGHTSTHKDNKTIIGAYTSYQAYGRIAIHQFCNECGGVRDITQLGTKRETYDKLCMYIEGIKEGMKL